MHPILENMSMLLAFIFPIHLLNSLSIQYWITNMEITLYVVNQNKKFTKGLFGSGVLEGRAKSIFRSIFDNFKKN